ncbi:MAG TPA: hypothetical protein EYN66_03930 [Myxococcales bacterium]|nr:hypothetical protein [Myxococcales bacterium]
MKKYRPHPDAAYRVIDDHVFIITPDSRQHELNGEVELMVWRMCEEKSCTEEELLDAITRVFIIERLQANSDLNGFLSEMILAGVLSAT